MPEISDISMSFLEWSNMVAKYGHLYDNVLKVCDASFSTVLEKNFNVKQEYLAAAKLVENEEPKKRKQIMKYVGIRRIVDAVTTLMKTRRYVPILSPEIWMMTWLADSAPYRKNPVIDRTIEKYKERAMKHQEQSKSISMPDGSLFVISPFDRSILAVCCRNDDESLAAIRSSCSNMKSVRECRIASMKHDCWLWKEAGYKIDAHLPIEMEFRPSIWDEQDEENELFMFVCDE